MRRVRASQLGVVLGYVLAASAFTWPLPLFLGTHFTGDPGGDTGVYVWNQWVFHQELTTGHNPLATEKILSLTSRVDLTQHNYTAFLNLLALPLISVAGHRHVVQRRLPAGQRAECHRGLRPDPQRDRGNQVRGVSRRAGVCVGAGDDRAHHRSLQPGRGRSVACLPVVPDQCGGNTFGERRGLGRPVHGLGGALGRVLRRVLPDDRRDLSGARRCFA